MLQLFSCVAVVYSAVFFLACGRRDGLLLSLGMSALMALLFALNGCAASKFDSPLLATPTGPRPNDSSLVAAPWLTPAPEGLNNKQADAWQAARTQALANSTAPVGKIKNKNVGNVKDKHSEKVKTTSGVSPLLLVGGLLALVVVCFILW
jgi:hypothetical protein